MRGGTYKIKIWYDLTAAPQGFSLEQLAERAEALVDTLKSQMPDSMTHPGASVDVSQTPARIELEAIVNTAVEGRPTRALRRVSDNVLKACGLKGTLAGASLHSR